MSLSKREFLQMLGAAGVAGMGLARHADADAATAEQALYDLPTNVAPNRQVNLAVKMVAPKSIGSFVTTWVMRIGNEIFCSMEQKITTK